MKARLGRALPFVVTAIVVATVLLAWLVRDSAQEDYEPGPRRHELLLEVGFERRPVSASFLVNVCVYEDPEGREAPECRDGATAERPTVVSVELGADVRAERRGQIPSETIQLSAVNVGADGLRVDATFRADEVDGLEGGQYESSVVVLRSAQPPIVLTMAIVVDDRSGLWLTGFVALLFGGTAGLGVRWISETGTPLASGYRRLRRARRLLPADVWPLLPADVEEEFVDAADALEQKEPERLDTAVTRLERDLPLLRSTARALARVAVVRVRLDEVADRPDLADDVRAAARRTKAALDTLARRVRERTWPWGDATEQTALRARVEAILDAADQADELLDGVEMGARKPSTDFVARAAMIADEGAEALFEPRLREAGGPAVRRASAVAARRGGRPRLAVEPQAPIDAPVGEEDVKDKEGWARRLADLVAWVPLVAILAALIAIGLQDQVDDAGYGGSFDDNLELWLWAFGVAVTGGTVLSVLGQSTAGRTSSGTPRPPSPS